MFLERYLNVYSPSTPAPADGRAVMYCKFADKKPVVNVYRAYAREGSTAVLLNSVTQANVIMTAAGSRLMKMSSLFP